VLANITAGFQAYQLKREKAIKTLLIGPNVVSSISEFDSFLTWPLIDAYLANCQWVMNNFVSFNPSIEKKVRLWFSGVDETYWKPTCHLSKRCLIMCCCIEKQMRK